MTESAADGVRPARKYSWEPFLAGNSVGLRHGAWSDRKLAPIVDQILADVLDDPATEYLQARRFHAELRSWAVNEARCRLLESYIAKLAEESGDDLGDPTSERTRSAWALLHRSETRAQSGRDRLGLSPASASKIGRDLAMMQAPRTIEDLKRAGRELLAELDRAAEPGDQDQEVEET